MSDQLFEDGKVITVDGQELECSAVSHQELEPGVRSNFVYHFRLKSEIDAERKAEEERQAQLEEGQQLNNVASEEQVSQPDQPEEETHYVR